LGGSGGGGSSGGLPGASPRVDGKEFFRQARARLSYEQFSSFLASIKELNAGRQSREDTLKRARDLFGVANDDLYGECSRGRKHGRVAVRTPSLIDPLHIAVTYQLRTANPLVFVLYTNSHLRVLTVLHYCFVC
jgi:hypothetical protein